MKLKSKLIATIVSICAAIAVMGVGVWAATTKFTVTVSNHVEFAVTNLAGTIHVKGTAKVDTAEIYTADADKLDKDLFVSQTAGEPYSATIDATSYKGAGMFNNKEGANQNYKITNDTKSASLSYTFTYTPVSGATGTANTLVTITPGASLPTLGSIAGASMKCTYTVNGVNTDLENSTPVKLYATPGQALEVTITCTYENANCISVNATGDFNFTIEFTASTAVPEGYVDVAGIRAN